MMFFHSKHKRLLIGLAVIVLAFGLTMILSQDSRKPSVDEILNPTPTPPPTETPPPTPTPVSDASKYVLLDVPFTSQAPNADWSDPRQQDGCEEASILMGWMWLKNVTLTKDQAEAKIIDMAAFEDSHYGYNPDISAQDTAQLFKDYFKYDKVVVTENISIDDIKSELRQGRLVLVPANGQKLGNPNFTGDGPYTHMLVVRGFDDKTKEFITNDPGTRKGNLYHYDYNVLYNAMVNYPTGHHESQDGRPKAMITISK